VALETLLLHGKKDEGGKDMLVHEVFAQIFEGEVKNVMVCENYPVADYLTKMVFGDTAYAVNISQYSVGISDKYHDNLFWRINKETGEEIIINPLPTQEQEVAQLKAENEELTLALAEIIGGAL